MAKKKTARKSKKNPNGVPFEQSFSELQEIVSQLEQGQLTLGDSLEKYEQGVKHLRDCYAALDQAERKIELLVELDEQGRMITRSFTDNDSTDDSDGESPDGSQDGLF